MKSIFIVLFSLWFLSNVYFSFNLLIRLYKNKKSKEPIDGIDEMVKIWGFFFTSFVMIIFIGFNILFEMFKKK